MPSHYSAVGFQFELNTDFNKFAQRLHTEAQAVATRRGTYFRWQTGSGAELWFQVSPTYELTGVHPHFNGQSRLKVRLTRRIRRDDDEELDGMFYAWVNPGNGDEDGEYPLVFACTDFWNYWNHGLPTIAEVQITAFAHELSFYESPEAYLTSQKEGAKFDSQSFVPSGTFVASDDAVTAHAFFAGHVLAAESRTNEETGCVFHWALVDSLGGAFDVVVDPAVLSELPRVGGVLHGTYWLSGRITKIGSQASRLKKLVSRFWPAD